MIKNKKKRNSSNLLTSSPVLCVSKKSISCRMIELKRACLILTATLSPDTESIAMYT